MELSDLETPERLSESEDSEISVSLSCRSSPFEEDGDEDRISAVSDDEGDEVAGAVGGLNINPYQFEPYASNSSSSSSEEEENANENRLQDTTWCNCGKCIVMPTARECVCCLEISKVVDVKNETDNIQCITDQPGFHPICLDEYVLMVAYFQYRQQYGNRPEQANERHRYTAYRQFVRWCWQFLGREVRVVLPSCVVHTIRTAFPSDHYTGFHQADSD